MSTLSKSKKFLLVERTPGVSFGLCLDVIMNTHRSNVIFGISNVIFIAIKKKRITRVCGEYTIGDHTNKHANYMNLSKH